MDTTTLPRNPKLQKSQAPVHKKPHNREVSKRHMVRFARHEAKLKLRVVCDASPLAGDRHRTFPCGPLEFTPYRFRLEKMAGCKCKKMSNDVIGRTNPHIIAA